MTMQSEANEHCLPSGKRVLHGSKPDLKVAQAALPVGINHPPQALLAL